MNYRVVKAKWAKRLLQAKFFVVMTDTHSAILFEGVDPESITDRTALEAQAAEIEYFYGELGLLVKRHQKAVAKALQKKTVKKIPVRQG